MSVDASFNPSRRLQSMEYFVALSEERITKGQDTRMSQSDYETLIRERVSKKVSLREKVLK
jgi:hypothetical protein